MDEATTTTTHNKLLTLELRLEVHVEEGLDLRALGAHLEDGQVAGGLQLAQDQGACYGVV